MAADDMDHIAHRRMFWIGLVALVGTLYSTFAFAMDEARFGAVVSGLVSAGLVTRIVGNWRKWRA